MEHNMKHRLFENEKNVVDELKAKGMEIMFEVDKEAFAKKCEQAIYEVFPPR